eukprot:CAMPEP_0204565698 /NCGR_PEP_ID=MMETSP0661-20131031/35623_1 /ASSEMBLY_ACC=CAM_ASM_000606 /TAXON_ID=109239 /ORGANISM="Alexandrium margalefi, Strain AMGDE01CS-322" /LENGTH=138 /DNA_ID=CAMNT_0051573473 /DNA_START=96 /DNA_END=512 /DNA_ORIENTATION=-
MALSERQLAAGAKVGDDEIAYWATYGVQFNRIGHKKNDSKKDVTAASEEHQHGDSVAINGCRSQVRGMIAAGNAQHGGTSYDEDFKQWKHGGGTKRKAEDRAAALVAKLQQADPKIRKKAEEEKKKTGRYPHWVTDRE